MYKCFQWTLLLITLCTVQELVESDDCNEAGNCTEMDKCILHYTELEEYILSNKTILKNITEAFFRADKPAITKFLRITYNLQICRGQHKYPANANITSCTGCTHNQSVYIWSKSPICLLGPRPLFFLTLFAVDVSEASITIELPCLCGEVYYNLLSRLTYLIKVYSVSDGVRDQHFVDFINPNFFCAKVASVMLFIALTVHCVYPKLCSYTETALKQKPKSLKSNGKVDDYVECQQVINMHLASLFLTNMTMTVILFGIHITSNVEYILYGNEVFYGSHDSNSDDHAIPIWHTVISLFTMTISLILVITGYACLKCSSKKSTENENTPLKMQDYGTFKETKAEQKFSSEDTEQAHSSEDTEQAHSSEETEQAHSSQEKTKTGSTNSSAGHCKVLIIIIKEDTKCETDNDKTNGVKNKKLLPSTFQKPAAVSITINVIYLGSYYSPFMVLAFIHDPIQSSLIYFLLMGGVICLYLIFFGASNLYYFIKMTTLKEGHKSDNPDSCRLHRFIYCIESWAAVILIAYMAVLITYLFKLGNFDSLDDLQSLTLPVILLFLSYLFLKPVLKDIKSLLYDEDNNNNSVAK
ncbi:uncharacterized protein [Dysidea avara]|uniref:uncharacterized protein isoform X3 n=1 Tax=Dysidea avara TaxID=196820 RepID=UPI003317AE6D